MKGAAFRCPFSIGPVHGCSLIVSRYNRLSSSLDIDMMNDHQSLPDTPVTELDLRGVICPYNFVKTKLKLETLKQGQVLSVLLDEGDPSAMFLVASRTKAIRSYRKNESTRLIGS